MDQSHSFRCRGDDIHSSWGRHDGQSEHRGPCSEPRRLYQNPESLQKPLRGPQAPRHRPDNYTPNLDEATHILELPFYDPDTRHYELIEDGVSLLRDCEMFDGGLSDIWRSQARNIQQPEEDVVNLFTMHTTVVSRSRCPPCRLVLNIELCNAIGNSACSRCIQFKIAVENPPRVSQNLDKTACFRCC